MAETKQIRLVPAVGGIPHSFKAYRTINVSPRGLDPNSPKVIHVALPKNVVVRGPPQNNIPDFSSVKSDEDTDAGAPLSKNALLARENRLKKKRYINGLEENLALTKKENENLMSQLKEKDATIENLKKEVMYFQSILANVKEISSLIRTVKQESSMPITTSLPPAGNPMKRSSDIVTELEPTKRSKMDRLSESSGESSTFFEEDDDLYKWLPQSPLLNSPLDPEPLDFLSSFTEEDLSIPSEDILLSNDETLTTPTIPSMPGVCLHIQNKKVSLEFCSSCASKALDKWMLEA